MAGDRTILYDRATEDEGRTADRVGGPKAINPCSTPGRAEEARTLGRVKGGGGRNHHEFAARSTTSLPFRGDEMGRNLGNIYITAVIRSNA